MTVVNVVSLLAHREQRDRVIASLGAKPVYPKRPRPESVVVRPFPTQPGYPPAA